MDITPAGGDLYSQLGLSKGGTRVRLSGKKGEGVKLYGAGVCVHQLCPPVKGGSSDLLT